MATQEKYQGWANWETWNVALWFGNDQGLYHAVREHPTKFTAASAKAFTKEMLPNGTPDFKSPRSYSKVDWKEIADDFNEMRGDGVSETRGAWHPRVRAVEDERPYVRQPVMHAPTQSAYRGGRHGARFRVDLDEHCALTEQALGRPLSGSERIICKRAWEEGRSPEFAANTIRRAMVREVPYGRPMPPSLREHPYPPSPRRPAARPTRPLPRRR